MSYRRLSLQLFLLLGIAVLAAGLRSGSAAAQGPAAGPSPTNPSALTVGHTHLLPPRGSAAATAAVANTPASGQAAVGGFSTTNNLTNHAGPTVSSAAVYAIYWEPTGGSSYETSTPGDTTGDARYESLVDAYPANLNATPFFAILSQYPNGGATAGSSVFRAKVVDNSTPYPHAPLQDADIQAEVTRVATAPAQNWPLGLGSLFVVFTPLGVNSCSGTSCSFTQYCAYHGDFSYNSLPVLYANMPDAGTNFSACGPQADPSGDHYVDAAANLLSHEYSEAITDPELNAWYDAQGYEIGDKCAWNFGPALNGSSGSSAYDVTLNSTNYEVQQEWSNGISGCSLVYGAPGAPSTVTATAGNASATVNWSAAAPNGSAITGYTVTGAPGGSCKTTGATSCTVTGLTNGTVYTFTVTATNAAGTGSPSAASNQVTPTATGSPMVLSGSVHHKPSGSLTVQALVNGQPCGTSVSIPPGPSSNFSNLKVPSSCAGAGNGVKLQVRAQNTGQTETPAITYNGRSNYCLSYNPGATVSGLTLDWGTTSTC